MVLRDCRKKPHGSLDHASLASESPSPFNELISFVLSKLNLLRGTIGLILIMLSCPARSFAVPRDPLDCPCINTSTILNAQYNLPSGILLPQLTCNGSVVQPKLKTFNESLGQSSTVIASTTATPTGLFAHKPPSIRGVPAARPMCGKVSWGGGGCKCYIYCLFLIVPF